MTWLAAIGWIVAGLLAVVALAARRRLEEVACAEHELRGPVAALALGVEQVRRGRAGAELAGLLEAQLDRSRAGLADLSAALGRERGARRRRPTSLERLARDTAAGWAGVAAGDGRLLRLDWRAGPAPIAADRGHLAQALGNLLSNAIEHGGGEVELRGRRVGGAVRIEVADAHGPGHIPADNGGAARPGSRKRRGPASPGRGRGLAIASRAVEKSGGRLDLIPGRAGMTAVLEVPLEDR
jgi:signal transduction histidine kinase